MSGTRWEKAAEAYATGEHKSGRELQLVVDFAAPIGNERVLDIGTGAGHTALALAPHVSSVVLTDPVATMLATARRLSAEAGVRNADFVEAIAERLPFPDASFDIVTTRLAAHHFDDVPLAFREVARVLRRGGVFIFVDRSRLRTRRARPTRTRSRRCAIRPTGASTRSESGSRFASRAASASRKLRWCARPTTSSPGSSAAARTRRHSSGCAPVSSTLRYRQCVISRSSLTTPR